MDARPADCDKLLAQSDDLGSQPPLCDPKAWSVARPKAFVKHSHGMCALPRRRSWLSQVGISALGAANRWQDALDFLAEARPARPSCDRGRFTSYCCRSNLLQTWWFSMRPLRHVERWPCFFSVMAHLVFDFEETVRSCDCQSTCLQG